MEAVDHDACHQKNIKMHPSNLQHPSYSSSDMDEDMKLITNLLVKYLAKTRPKLGQFMQQDFLVNLIKAMEVLCTSGEQNTLALLSKALAGSRTSGKSFSVNSPGFRFMQMMLVSVEHASSEEELEKCSDNVVPWLFGVPKSCGADFVSHINHILFPDMNFQYKFTAGSCNCKISLVNVNSKRIQCEYENVNNSAHGTHNDMSHGGVKEDSALCEINGDHPVPEESKLPADMDPQPVQDMPEVMPSVKEECSDPDDNDEIDNQNCLDLEELQKPVENSTQKHKSQKLTHDDQQVQSPLGISGEKKKCKLAKSEGKAKVYMGKLRSKDKKLKGETVKQEAGLDLIAKAPDDTDKVEHEESSDKDGHLFCSFCRKPFTSTEMLDEHTTSRICLTCGVCEDKIFENRTQWAEHRLQSHLSTEDLQCQCCKRKFKSEDTLRKHLQSIDCLTCLFCCKIFGSCKDFETHKMVAHVNLECKICKGTFSSIGNLNKHKKKNCQSSNMKAKRIAIHKCNSCEEEFKNQGSLRTHMNKTHPEPLQCLTCNEDFKTRVQFRNHMSQMHGNDVICEVCGDSFKGTVRLNLHHRKKHAEHFGFKRNRFECPHCQKLFRENCHRRKHIDVVHKKLRNFSCDVCGKTFSSASHLEEHVGLHDGIKRYQCEQCGEGFIHRAQYKRHVVKHAGLKRFICPVCKNKYDTMDYLRLHLKRTHKVDPNSLDLPKFSNPGTSLPAHMRKRRYGGRQPNSKEVELPPAYAQDNSVDAEDSTENDQSVVVVENVPVSSPFALNEEVAGDFQDVGEMVEDSEMAGGNWVEVQEGEGSEIIYYLPENVEFIQMGDNIVKIQ